jgi:hypothetical protein
VPPPRLSRSIAGLVHTHRRAHSGEFGAGNCRLGLFGVRIARGDLRLLRFRLRPRTQYRLPRRIELRRVALHIHALLIELLPRHRPFATETGLGLIPTTTARRPGRRSSASVSTGLPSTVIVSVGIARSGLAWTSGLLRDSREWVLPMVCRGECYRRGLKMVQMKVQLNSGTSP